MRVLEIPAQYANQSALRVSHQQPWNEVEASGKWLSRAHTLTVEPVGPRAGSGLTLAAGSRGTSATTIAETLHFEERLVDS